MSEKLETNTQYNLADTQITKATGPQHTVKLSTGVEVQVRSVTRNLYDEGTPGGKTYDLLTKLTVGAEYEGKSRRSHDTDVLLRAERARLDAMPADVEHDTVRASPHQQDCL